MTKKTEKNQNLKPAAQQQYENTSSQRKQIGGRTKLCRALPSGSWRPKMNHGRQDRGPKLAAVETETGPQIYQGMRKNDSGERRWAGSAQKQN
jgi:hypothetical protein